MKRIEIEHHYVKNSIGDSTQYLKENKDTITFFVKDVKRKEDL